MSSLSTEVENVQNPAIGAVILWRFCCGYVAAHPTSASPPLPLLFFVLPVVLHKATSEFVRRTRLASGLRAFASKFGEAAVSKQDVLLQLQDRARRWRPLTLQSVELGSACHLLCLRATAEVTPLTRSAVRGATAEVNRLLGDAEKLGTWCGSLSLHEVTNALKVRL
ncbi:MAG: hypothetical protein J0L92_33905 [Deltaproteobacteria bacterium]|nr:hypothetical protein [Deltaproteobacteria bacterium]